MDVLSEDLALQANLERYNIEGFDNDALDFQQLEDFINSDGALNFPVDDSVFSAAAGGPAGRGMDAGQQQSKAAHELPGSAPGSTNTPQVAFCQPTTSAPPQQHHHNPHHQHQLQQQHQQQQHHQQQQQQQQQQQHPQLIAHKSSPFCHTQLPDSPPDSGSEPYSPADGQHTDHPSSCDVKASIVGSMTTLPQLSYTGGPMVHPGAPTHLSPPHHHSPPGLPTPDLHPQHQQQHHQQQQQQQQQMQKAYPQYSNGEPPKLNHPPQPQPVAPQQQQQQAMPAVSMGQLTQQQMMPAAQFSMNNTGQHPNKKRKYPDSPPSTLTPGTLTPGMLAGIPGAVLGTIKQEPNECDFTQRAPGVMPPDAMDDDYSYDMSTDPGGMFLDSTYQVIKWQTYQPTKWASVLDANLKELPGLSYRVDSDKGFNFSVPDDAFVCQKKNHFQVTVHIGLPGDPKYVKTPEGSTQKIDSFYVHFNGIKSESPSQVIKVEQSQSDRSKKAFHPIKVGGFTVRQRQFSERVDMSPDQVTKITVGRLHFSETTSNNMRKKGKPNPDQRYFMLVVALHAHCGDGSVLVAAHVSERIIVRASNPGQFDSDVDVLWNKGQTPDSVYHMGRVGVNTDRPDEAMTVHGNLRVTGHITQPSDQRAKTDIVMVDTAEQLQKVKGLNVYKYRYNDDFAEHAGLSEDELEDTGVLAQEVKEVLPDAVRETGDIVLPNGQRIENFLVVNKDRIYMENVGAVKELCKLTDNLENRIDELEQMNKKLAKLKRYDSTKSTSSAVSSCSTMSSRTGSVIGNGTVGNGTVKKPPSSHKPHHHSSHHHHSTHNKHKRPNPADLGEQNICSNRFIQITVTVLVLVMAFCLVSITTLYILEKQKAPDSSNPVESVMTDFTSDGSGFPQVGNHAPALGDQPNTTGESLSPNVLNISNGTKSSTTPLTAPPTSDITTTQSTIPAYVRTEPVGPPPLDGIAPGSPDRGMRTESMMPPSGGARFPGQGHSPGQAGSPGPSGPQGSVWNPNPQSGYIPFLVRTRVPSTTTSPSTPTTTVEHKGPLGAVNPFLKIKNKRKAKAGNVINSTSFPDGTTEKQPETRAGALLPSKDAVVTPLTPPRCVRSECQPVCCPPMPLYDPDTSYSGRKTAKSYPGEDRGRIAKPQKPYNKVNDNSSNNKTFQYTVVSPKPNGQHGNPSMLIPVPKPTQYPDPIVESPPQLLNDIPTVKMNDVSGYGHRQKRSVNGSLPEMNPKYRAMIVIHQINRTINSTFCSTDACRLGEGGNFTYSVPISSYFPITHIFLDFKMAPNASLSMCQQQVSSDVCNTEKTPPDPLKGSSLSQWDLPIGYYYFSRYSFRVADNDVDACSLPAHDVGTKFAEYNLSFHRVCENGP